MKKTDFDDLFIDVKEIYPYRSEYVFYVDENLKIPYNGIVLEYIKGVLYWEFEVKDGFIDGIEKLYYEETGELEQENEIKHYLRDGLQKEFYKNGNLYTISIAIRDIYVYSVVYDEIGNIIQKDYIREKTLNSPSYAYIKERVDIYMEKYKHIKELDLK